MFLKSLDMLGFKSFADRTHVEFADGITALLGPNGCGKSNVVDAVKWVLAENRAKNLRAEKMEDVVFNGTETRPPLNIAEVTLTIANENNLLPLDDSEIAIKRRLYRSGENEYFINNRQVGPTEIRRLFMDTGVGKAAYSVMEQGKIDQILSNKPEDRRYLFEEAAGISRSKAECAEAERELERTRQNLETITVALTENKRTYDSLKIQSEKTNRYRKLKDEIFEYELDIQLLKLKDFSQNKARQEASLKEIEQKRTDVQNEINNILNTLTENNDKLKDLQTQMSEKNQELIKIQTEKNGKQELARQFNLRSSEIREKIGQLELHKKAIQERIDDLNEEIDEQEADTHSKEKQLSETQKNIDGYVESIGNAESQITENERIALDNAKKIEALEQERENFQKELEAITEDIVTELDKKLKDTGFSSSANKKAKEEMEAALSKIKIFSDGRKNIFSDFVSITSHTESDYKKFSEDVLSSFDEIKNQLSALENAIEGYSKTMPSFIDEFLSPEGIITKKRSIDQKISDNLNQINRIQSEVNELHKMNASLTSKINEYRETLHKLRIDEAAMQQQIFASKQKTDLLRRNLATEQNSMRDNDDQLYLENKHADELKEQIDSIQETLAEIEIQGRRCVDRLDELTKEIEACNSSVSGKQNTLRKKQEEQQKYQAQYEKLNLELVTSDNDIRNIKQNFIETHSRDLMEFEPRMYKITTPVAVLRDNLITKREEMKNLGSINFSAPEEFIEQKERYEKLQESYDDTKKSLDNLIRVSEEIKSKSTELFLETYNKIKKNFHNMFRRMFNGGRGELRLVDPQNVLTTGIDIFAQPPGKKLENISLLSGGEKTMTAVALLFATYQVRPSPFCLLDEIDAALDDKNVGNFVQALRSFAKLSQYIVITHNKKTVLGARTMLGVTMEEAGISKIITMRLDKDLVTGEDFVDENEIEDEDIDVEEGAVIPPRPPQRIYNADGTITDPMTNVTTENLRSEAKEERPEDQGDETDL